MYLLETDGDPTKATVDTILETQARSIGTKPAIFYGPEDRTVSYNEVNETANRIGNTLVNMGVGRSDKVSVMVDQPLQVLFTFFGLQKCSAIYSPINTELKGQALSFQLNDTEPELLVLEDRYTGNLNDIKESLTSLPHVILYDSGSDSEPLDDAFDTTPFSELLNGSAANPGLESQWDDVASILYTSGTTGNPKGVIHTHRYITAYSENVWKLARASGSMADDYEYVRQTSLPLYHIGGLYADTMGTMIAGGSVSLWDSFSPTDFWDRVEAYGSTQVTLLSTMISWLVQQPERPDDRENTLDKVNSVPLLENAVEMAERFGFNFVITGYGSTEIGAATHGIIHAAKGENATPAEFRRTRPPEKFRERAEADGFNVADEHPGSGWMGTNWRSDKYELSILDDNDERVSAGEVGQLCVRPTGPAILFAEYDDRPEETVETWRNLWYHTGDAVRREGEHYYFVDRIGSVIRRRGENISSGQVQEITNSHEAVDQSAAFPVPADEGGEDEVAVAVQPSDGATLTESAMREYFEAEMPAFMHPKYVLITEEIPTTPTNKIEKYKLRERLTEQDDS